MIQKIIDFLFGRENFKESPQEEVNNLKPLEDLIQSELFEEFKKNEGKNTLMLKPHYSDHQLEANISKMGGTPNLKNFESYPVCEHCNTKLNFVLQLKKPDFPNFYFPDKKNLFQLFRCPNFECEGIDFEKFDLCMYHYYHNDDSTIEEKTGNHEVRDVANPNFEEKVPDCKFHPKEMIDYPNYDDTESNFYSIVEEKYEEEVGEYLFDKYSARIGTKIGGYPSWTQSPNYPICQSCDKEKEFLFQLSSEEIEDEYETRTSKEWSPHGIMMGDVGNIYYFYCENCGVDSIESNWDCS
jgi:uncharacterized protein YwqG